MEASPATEDRPLMDEKTFLDNFNNGVSLRKTYLCYEVEHIRDDNTVKVSKGFPAQPGWVNLYDPMSCSGRSSSFPDTPALAPLTPFLWESEPFEQPYIRHAELILLERMASWKLDKKLSYKVTFFISWSPCGNCAKELVKFLRENKRVALRIFAARIHTKLPGYKAGLRTLAAANRAEIAMMTSEEFEHCWETFVDHQGRPFPPWDHLDAQSEQLSLDLRKILQN